VKNNPRGRVRYAVVGLGYIGQIAVLPAFRHATKNSELAALVSGDREKLRKLGRRYGVTALYGYERFDECLEKRGHRRRLYRPAQSSPPQVRGRGRAPGHPRAVRKADGRSRRPSAKP
jgi:hypothetical protein